MHYAVKIMDSFKCKMCGGTLEFEPGDTYGVCENCGTKQLLPKPDDGAEEANSSKDEKKINKKLTIIGAAAAVAIAVSVLVMITVINPSGKKEKPVSTNPESYSENAEAEDETVSSGSAEEYSKPAVSAAELKAAMNVYESLLTDLKYLDELDEMAVEYPLEITGYSITDINSDGMPELIFSTEADISSCHYYYGFYYDTYELDDGSASSEKTVQYGGSIYAFDLQYSEKANYVMAFQKGVPSHYDIELYDTDCNVLFHYYGNIGVNRLSEANTVYTLTSTYEDGERDMTEKEFNEEFGELLSPDYSPIGRNTNGIEPGEYVVSTQSSDLLVHDIPKNGTEIIGKLPKGTAVNVEHAIDGWALISYKNDYGYAWVSSDYLKPKQSGGAAKSNDQLVNDAVNAGIGLAENVIGSIF